MSLLDTPLWEVIKGSFSAALWQEIASSITDTLYMTVIASIIMLIIELVLGVLLTVTGLDGLFPLSVPYSVISWIINCLRSLPQMIMIILMIPVARLLFGQSYGTNACIVAVAASCIPMYARIVESSLLEIDKGKIEAARSIGSTNPQIIWHVLLPETAPSLIRGFTVAVIAVVSITARAGMFGAGGIGDIAVRFGCERFQYDKLFACVYVLIVIVQVAQWGGTLLSTRLLKQRNLI